MKVRDLIRQAFSVAGIVAANESPEDFEASGALDALIMLLQQWSSSPAYAYRVEYIDVPIQSGKHDYTIGVGSQWDVNASVQLLSDKAFAVISDTQKPISLSRDTAANEDEFGIYYTVYPNHILLRKRVDFGYDKIRLRSLVVPSDDLTLNSELEMPQVFNRALKYAIAQEIAPEYQAQLSNEFMRNYQDAMRRLHSFLARPVPKRIDPTLQRMSGFCRGNFLNGY